MCCEQYFIFLNVEFVASINISPSQWCRKIFGQRKELKI